MLIKFFARGCGAGAGPVNYVCGQTSAHDSLRMPEPEVLYSDPETIRQVIDTVPHKYKYSSGVISFAPDDLPTPTQQEEVMRDFERTAFPGLEGNQYSILWVKHTHMDRVELHFVIPRVELQSGKSYNPAPPGWQKRYDPLRDMFNFKYGWARPDDPARMRAVQPGIAAKIPDATLSDEFHQHLKKVKDLRTGLEVAVTELVRHGQVKNRNDILTFLREQGASFSRIGKDYVTVVMPNEKRVQLKGAFFSADFDAAAFIARKSESYCTTPNQTQSELTKAHLAQQIDSIAAYNHKRYCDKQKQGNTNGQPSLLLQVHDGNLLGYSSTSIFESWRNSELSARRQLSDDAVAQPESISESITDSDSERIFSMAETVSEDRFTRVTGNCIVDRTDRNFAKNLNNVFKIINKENTHDNLCRTTGLTADYRNLQSCTRTRNENTTDGSIHDGNSNTAANTDYTDWTNERHERQSATATRRERQSCFEAGRAGIENCELRDYSKSTPNTIVNVIHPLSLHISELQHFPILVFSPTKQFACSLDMCEKMLSFAEQQIIDAAKCPIVRHHIEKHTQIVTSFHEYNGKMFSRQIDSFAYNYGNMAKHISNCIKLFDAILNNAVKTVLHPQNTKKNNDEHLFSLPSLKALPSIRASAVVAQRPEQHITAFDALNLQMENILQQPIQIQHPQPNQTVTISEVPILHALPSNLLQGKRVRVVDDLVWRVDLLGGMLDEALDLGLREKLIWRAISKVAQHYQNTLEALVSAAFDAWAHHQQWTLNDVENAVWNHAKLENADKEWLITAIRFEYRIEKSAKKRAVKQTRVGARLLVRFAL